MKFSFDASREEITPAALSKRCCGHSGPPAHSAKSVLNLNPEAWWDDLIEFALEQFNCFEIYRRMAVYQLRESYYLIKLEIWKK